MNIREFIYIRIAGLQGDLSDRRISKGIGKNRNYLQNMRLNNSLPSLETLCDICDYFHITLEEFFAGQAEKTENPLYRRLDEIVSPENLDIFCRAADSMSKERMDALAGFLRDYMSE